MLFISQFSKLGRAQLASRSASGELHKITPTCYINKATWENSFPSEKLQSFGIAASQYHKKATLTGRAAALLHGLPVCSNALSLRFLKPLSSHSKLPGVSITRAPQEVLDRSEHLSVPNEDEDELLDVEVTSIADTIAYLALHDGVRDAVVAADHCLRNRLLSKEELCAILRTYEGKRRYSRIKQTMHLMSGLSESVRESELKVMLVEEGFTGFTIQPQIFLTHSCSKYRPDFAFFNEMVILEYDGADKYESGSTAYLRREIDRHHELTNAGFTLVRIRKEHFDDGSWVDMLRKALSKGPQQNSDSYWIEDSGVSF